MSEICELANGQRIRFSLSERKGNPLYFVRFKGPDGRKELTTNEKNKKRAQESALAVIRRAYEENQQNYLTWDDAIDLLKSSTASEGLRPTTIDRYLYGISALRKIFPDSKPGDITPEIAESFKLQRAVKVAARTLEGDLNSLTIVFGKWFRKLKIVEKNPFEEIDPPKTDKPPPRFIEVEELKAFYDYLGEKWFRLPVLFLEVKAAIGCRIGELTTALSADLVDGRLFFRAKAHQGARGTGLPPSTSPLQRIARGCRAGLYIREVLTL